MERLEKQIAFLREIDKVKQIFRQTKLLDGSRYENDAEHAWHVAVMAMVLAEHANEAKIDVAKVIKMVLIHDLVEIDAGDVIVYDAAGRERQKIAEAKAAERIFPLLPADQAKEFRQLWEEFEARSTPEAKFAAALDRLEPILQNYATQGGAWRKHDVTRQRAEAANQHVAAGSETIWNYIQQLFADAEEKGYFPQQ